MRKNVAIALPLFLSVTLAPAQTTTPLQKLNLYLNSIGIAQADQRAQKVASIQTRQEAEQRQAQVRTTILKLIGGLPDRNGPVPVRQFGSIPGDGFRVEKIASSKLSPTFTVTANVFVLTAPGLRSFSGDHRDSEATAHGGKQSEYNWGANFARAGIVALTVDPIGQGERMQHYDPELESSKIERLGEHEHASLSTGLIGDHVSRYFINDGMRGIDYLIQRNDVDAKHIERSGCSGGDHHGSFRGADPRPAPAATACFTFLKEPFSPRAAGLSATDHRASPPRVSTSRIGQEPAAPSSSTRSSRPPRIRFLRRSQTNIRRSETFLRSLRRGR